MTQQWRRCRCTKRNSTHTTRHRLTPTTPPTSVKRKQKSQEKKTIKPTSNTTRNTTTHHIIHTIHINHQHIIISIITRHIEGERVPATYAWNA
jgi:hypothetical protein